MFFNQIFQQNKELWIETLQEEIMSVGTKKHELEDKDEIKMKRI